MEGRGRFGVLEGHRFIRLTTYRRSGEAVPTPVWFALVEDRAHVFTELHTGKVKRIRNDPRVTLAPSNFRGRPRGESVEATARIMDEAEIGVADRALREKYGWQYRAYWTVMRLLRRTPPEHVFLELRSSADGAANP